MSTNEIIRCGKKISSTLSVIFLVTVITHCSQSSPSKKQVVVAAPGNPAQVSPLNPANPGPTTIDDGSGPEQASSTQGSVAVKNFDQYYHSLRLATGNVAQVAVSNTVGAVTQTSTALSYFNSAANLVLPQNTLYSSVNDAVVQTYPKLAAYFAGDFIAAELAKAAGTRIALGPVDTAVPANNTLTVFENVGRNLIARFLNRAASAEDIADIDTFYKAVFPTPPATAAALNQGLLTIITAVLSSSEFTTNN